MARILALQQETLDQKGETVKTMSWFNSSKKNESAMFKLSKRVFEISLSGAEALKPDLEKKFGKDSEMFNSKYISTVLEFIYFFIHLTDRYAFDQLGQERRNIIIDQLVPSTTDAVIATLFSHCSKGTKDDLLDNFYSHMNDATMEYGRCKEVFLRPEEDTRTLEKIKSGAKSKSMVGQLTDNLSQIIEGGVNLNALFTMLIWQIVIETSKKKELQTLISVASKEIR